MEREPPHSILGLTSRAHGKAQAPAEVSDYVHLGPDARVTHLGTGPLVCPAQIPEARRSDLGQPARFACDPEPLAVSCGCHTKIPLAVAEAPEALLLQRVTCAPAGTGHVLRNAPPAEATATRFQSGLRLQGAFHLDGQQTRPAWRGGRSPPHRKGMLRDSEMTTARPGSNVSTAASPTLSKPPYRTRRVLHNPGFH